MSWQPDLGTLNDDGEYQLVWVDDGEGSPDTTGAEPPVITEEMTAAAIEEGGTDSPAVGDDNYSNEGRNHPEPVTSGGFSLENLAAQLGLKKPDGSYDLKKILGMAGAGVGMIGALTQTPQTQKSIAELRAGIPATNTAPMWTAEQLEFGRRPMQTGSALQRIYAADMQSPITPGKTAQRFADGGEVIGALSQAFEGAVQGMDGGQSDLIEARLSPGEYVMDAESVSALGDGNTEAGIAKLDELRRKLREQKRNAPTNDIPSQARGPLSYMQGA